MYLYIIYSLRDYMPYVFMFNHKYEDIVQYVTVKWRYTDYYVIIHGYACTIWWFR